MDSGTLEKIDDLMRRSGVLRARDLAAEGVHAVVRMAFPVLLDFPAPWIRAYTRESVVAEKLHAMTALGLACVIRRKAATHSDGKRPPIPSEGGHFMRG